MPANPKKAQETIAAAINVIGKPLKEFGALDVSKRDLTPANKTIASKNPSPHPRELTIDSRKLYPSLILLIVTPKTAQLVVISGKYTPRALCKDGIYLFKIISTNELKRQLLK